MDITEKFVLSDFVISIKQTQTEEEKAADRNRYLSTYSEFMSTRINT